MPGKTPIHSLCCLFVLTLASSTLWAQARVYHGVHNPNATPMEQSPASLKTIFSNLGPTITNAYDDANGFFVEGPNTGFGEQWVAVPFIPKANSTVTQLQVAVGYYFSGTKQIIVGLYSDASGNVGTTLATATATNIPDFGTCCKMVTVNLTPTTVTGGTQYWIGVTSDDTNAPDFVGIWQSSNRAKAATNIGNGGWSSFGENWPAATARGTIP